MTAAILIEEFQKLPPEEQLEFQTQFDEMTIANNSNDCEGDGPDGSDLSPELRAFLTERMALSDQDNRRTYTIEETFQNCLKAIQK